MAREEQGASLAWKRLNLRGTRIASTREVRELSGAYGGGSGRINGALAREGYLIPLFKDLFYVRNAGEFQAKGFDIPVLEIVAMGLEKFGVENWYYGLDAALELNHVTSDRSQFTVHCVNDSFSSRGPRRIGDKELVFLKRGKACFGSGIRSESNYYFSDPEKTVLDLIYERFLRDRDDSNGYMQPLNAHYQFLDPIILLTHLEGYPGSFRRELECQIKGFYDSFS